MTTTERRNHFADAATLAPRPTERGSAAAETWAAHYAAFALAAHAAFKEELDDMDDLPPAGREAQGRPDLGALVAIATSSTAAAFALLHGDRPNCGVKLWDLTPECGALNGEYIDWLAEALDEYGINPAELYPDYSPRDFESPTRLGATR